MVSIADVPLSVRQRMMIPMAFGQFNCCALSLIMASFFAGHCADKYPNSGINATLVAIAMGTLDGAGIVFTPFFKYFVGWTGRKNALTFAYILLIVTNAGLAVLSYIPEDKWQIFYGGTVVCRFIMGIGAALVINTNNGIVCLAFSDDKAPYLSVTLGVGGLGQIIAPVIGSAVYGFGGYAFTFYFLAVLLTINLGVNTILVPSVLNQNRKVTSLIDRQEKLQAHLSA